LVRKPLIPINSCFFYFIYFSKSRKNIEISGLPPLD
jgi:hypothetical protein